MAQKRLLPTGECWCGCEREIGLGSFFAQGHDKRAEGMLIVLRYGSVAEFVEAHGYGPDGKNLLVEYEARKRGGS